MRSTILLSVLALSAAPAQAQVVVITGDGSTPPGFYSISTPRFFGGYAFTPSPVVPTNPWNLLPAVPYARTPFSVVPTPMIPQVAFPQPVLPQPVSPLPPATPVTTFGTR